jgi:hypothetical protein
VEAMCGKRLGGAMDRREGRIVVGPTERIVKR